MADARVTRLGREVLAAAEESAQVTRQGLQIALERPGANTSATVRVPRFGLEVLAATPAAAKVTRQGIQVALSRPGANAAATARVTRLGMEVLGAAPATAAVTRQGIQIAIERPVSAGTGTARVTRFGVEVLGRRFTPMSDFEVPAGFELFFHNWAQRCTLESSYVTDVAASAEDLAEERVGLIQKPYRRLSMEILLKGNSEANRLLVELRRLVDETSVVPLYCDAVAISANAPALATTVSGDFSRGRYFQNGPVVIAQLRPVMGENQTMEVTYETIDLQSASSAGLVFKTGLVNSYTAGRTVVMPLMKTHPQVEVQVRSETNNMLLASLEFDEVYGPTAIPPIASDLPSGFDSYSNFPILSTAPQWLNGLTSVIRREGSQEALGRGRVVFQSGARGRRISRLEFLNYRDVAWSLLRFFDSRRGRLMPFWVIDYDNLFTVTNISPAFVSVSPNGSLSAFQDESDYIGVVFSDGRAAVRKATAIQQVGGSWRVTIDASLPSGYSAADVVSFGRARLCRMESDALLERWTTTQVCELSIPVIELLAEQEVSIG